jgi:N,N'-diacetyllegionaminate synthase
MERLRPELIAEIGSVHDGSLGNALRLIDLASEVGADTVKFQFHIASEETTRDAPPPGFFSAEPRFDYFQRTAFRDDDWAGLKKHAESVGVRFLVSPFSVRAAQFLVDLGVPRLKIASGELDNYPLIEFAVQSGLEIILSTGMSLHSEIVRTLSAFPSHQAVTIMQCTSVYPCPPEMAGIQEIPSMREEFGRPVGYSDHTTSNTSAILAAGLGASVIEKHLTFSRRMYGSDAPYAAEPSQFRELSESLREIGILRATHPPRDLRVQDNLQETRYVFRHGLVASRSISRGEVLSQSDVRSKKPARGLSPWSLPHLVGRRILRDVGADESLLEEDIDWA